MSSVPRPRLTSEQYLAIERAAEFKSEFYDGQMYAMAGASFRHNQITSNLFINLGIQLRGGPCRPLGSDLRVSFGGGEYTYPDITVVCGTPQFVDGAFDTLTNPRVIIEILSPSTQNWDRGGKFVHYQRLASLQHYVLIGQETPTVRQHDRQTDGSWLLTEITWPHGVLILDSIAAAISLREIYLDVFSPDEST